VALVTTASVPEELATIGVVEASTSVEIVPQVTGVLERVWFEEGAVVQAGDTLFTIDTGPYNATLAVARAEQQRNQVLLERARAEVARARALEAEGLLSAQERAVLEADAAALEATVAAGKGRTEGARINVSFTTIKAPMAGRTGLLTKKPGSLVRENDPTPLVVIRSMAPAYVRFQVPETKLGEVRARQAKEPLVVRATARGADRKTALGVVQFLDNTVDVTTGTIALKAIFENRDEELWPGEFVDVVLQLGVSEGVTVAPEAAVEEGQEGSYVYVVGDDDRAHYRKIEVTRTTPTLAVIAGGLAPGERVVVDGQVRIADGVEVKVVPVPTATRGGP
jgi:multidrug efflux system membrane fusion protein